MVGIASVRHDRRRPPGGPARGFTLIELMVTVAIVALLATIALPSYQRYIRNAERAYATTWLSEKLMEMERLRLRTGDYPRSGGDLDRSAVLDALVGIDATQAFLGRRSGVTAAATDDSRYRLDVLAIDGLRPALQLTAIQNQTEDSDCATLSVDANGSQSSTDADGNISTAECWR